MGNLYHLHIPRTSGTGILYAIHKSFELDRYKKGLDKYENQTPGIFEFSYNHTTMSEWPTISGHFAINPILHNDSSLETFSVIREPVDHFVSIAAYRAMSSRREFTNEILDKFLDGKYETIFGCKLFSSDGNLQTKMLTCRMVEINAVLDVGDESPGVSIQPNGAWFVESDLPTGEKELIDRIKDITIFEINERMAVEKYLTYQFKDKFNVEFVGLGLEKMNSSVRAGIKPSPSQKKEILERSKLDVMLYEHITSQRKSHGND